MWRFKRPIGGSNRPFEAKEWGFGGVIFASPVVSIAKNAVFDRPAQMAYRGIYRGFSWDPKKPLPTNGLTGQTLKFMITVRTVQKSDP
jgi:hypothetical protein